MNLNNRMLNIDIKNNKKKQIKKRFFHKKTFFIEIKKQKIKNGILYITMQVYTGFEQLRYFHHLVID